MYKCKHFEIHELVPQDVYEKYGEKAWQFFDVSLLETLDQLREHFGSLTVNTWKWGGHLSQRGLRSFDYGGIGNRSLHKLGKAIDCSSKVHSSEDMRQYILNNQEQFPHIRGLELDVSWLHFDTRNRDGNVGNIFTFKP